jgi:hypothetical protein
LKPFNKYKYSAIILIILFSIFTISCKTAAVETTAAAAINKPSETTSLPTTEENALRIKVENYADDMEKYKEMPPNKFEALARDERLKYGQYIIDDTVANEGVFKIYYREGAKLHNFEKEYTPVSVSNDGQAIEENSEYLFQIACAQTVESGGLEALPKFDTANGIKCLSRLLSDNQNLL